MADMLMTAGDTAEALGVGSGLQVTGAAGSKLLAVSGATGGSTAGIIISRTTVAGESIAAGNVVCDTRNGIRKGYGLLSAVTEQDLEGVGITQVAVCALSATLFVRIYIKSADNKLYGKAFTINADNTVTDGAEVTLANYVINATWLVIRRITATQFMAGWIKNSDTKGYIISGTVGALNAITLGAEVNFHNGTTGSFDFKFTGTTYVLAYRDTGDTDYGHIVMGTVNGAAAITNDAAHDLKWISTAVDDIAVGIIPQTYGGGTVNRFIISYEKATNTMYEILGTWTGTTPSVTNFVEYGAIDALAIAGNDLQVVDTNKYIGTHGVTTATGWRLVYLRPGKLYAAESITYSDKAICYSQGAGALGRGFVHVVNPNVFIITLDAINAGFYQYNVARFYNMCMSFLGGNVHAFDTYHASALSTDGKLLVVYFNDAADGHHGHLIAYDVGLPLGIAMEANNGGTALLIAVAGLATIAAWGLTSKMRHYAVSDGTLTTTPNGWPILDAFSTTEALILKELETL